MVLREDSWPVSVNELRLSAARGKELMAVNVDDKIRELSTSQRTKVDVRATELIAEEMTQRELRKACKLKQSQSHRRGWVQFRSDFGTFFRDGK
jgi:hypothetical protein